MGILPLCYATACASALFPQMTLRTATRDPDFMAWIWNDDYYYVISGGCCHSDRPTPPMLDSACDSSFIAMFTCRSLVLRIDKSWKDSAFMALGFCLHHSVGVMWAPHQLNEPFSYFWWAILVPWYSSLFAERLPFPAHIPWFFPGCSWFLFQLLHPTMWKCYIIES